MTAPRDFDDLRRAERATGADLDREEADLIEDIAAAEWGDWWDTPRTHHPRGRTS